MKKDFKLFTSFWFIISLIVLLLNDLFFKQFYNNWLTGKLSDVAGLFIFPLFWATLVPKHKNKIFWLTGLAFIYWKSPYSQLFINSWNNLGLITIHRVVDYTDLIALAILPVGYYYEIKKESYKFIKINPILPFALSAFAFMATSYRTEVKINKSYHFNFSKDALMKKLDKIDSLNNGYRIQFTDRNPDTVEFRLPSSFCMNDVEIKMSVSELILDSFKLRDTTTELKLIKATHRCPKNRRDKKELIAEFEKLVIDRIKIHFDN